MSVKMFRGVQEVARKLIVLGISVADLAQLTLLDVEHCGSRERQQDGRVRGDDELRAEWIFPSRSRRRGT